MIEKFEQIMSDTLIAFYHPFGAAVIVAVLSMFLYLYISESSVKDVLKKWLNAFKSDSSFRRLFALAFYVTLVLFITLLNRQMWMNPISNVWGTWGFYDSKGKLSAEVFENTILFIPYTILLFWAFSNRIFKKITFGTVMWNSMKISFLSSLCIEVAQLILRLGTFQLSDLFFNTLGGIVGGLIYFIVFKIIKSKASTE